MINQNLDAATSEQLAVLITLNKNILKVSIDTEMSIIYTTASGYIGNMKVDEKGIWIKTEFYSSYDPTSNTYYGYVTERKNPSYQKEKI